MGVVYYANYLRYFEAARVEYLRLLGQDYRAIEAGGIVMAVVEAVCRYHLPARFDDLLSLGCRVSDLRRATFRWTPCTAARSSALTGCCRRRTNNSASRSSGAPTASSASTFSIVSKVV